MLEFTLDVSSLASLSGAWIRSFKIIYFDFLADFTTLKGANSNPIWILPNLRPVEQTEVGNSRANPGI
jgi:hypothetical protein